MHAKGASSTLRTVCIVADQAMCLCMPYRCSCTVCMLQGRSVKCQANFCNAMQFRSTLCCHACYAQRGMCRDAMPGARRPSPASLPTHGRALHLHAAVGTKLAKHAVGTANSSGAEYDTVKVLGATPWPAYGCAQFIRRSCTPRKYWPRRTCNMQQFRDTCIAPHPRSQRSRVAVCSLTTCMAALGAQLLCNNTPLS
jgi:hypothetical protein